MVTPDAGGRSGRWDVGGRGRCVSSGRASCEPSCEPSVVTLGCGKPDGLGVSDVDCHPDRHPVIDQRDPDTVEDVDAHPHGHAPSSPDIDDRGTDAFGLRIANPVGNLHVVHADPDRFDNAFGSGGSEPSLRRPATRDRRHSFLALATLRRPRRGRRRRWRLGHRDPPQPNPVTRRGGDFVAPTLRVRRVEIGRTSAPLQQDRHLVMRRMREHVQQPRAYGPQ